MRKALLTCDSQLLGGKDKVDVLLGFPELLLPDVLGTEL